MTDENDSGRPSSTPGGRAPLTLKPRTLGGAVSSGMVKQSFSHGRSKTVVVETKRRRPDGPGPSLGVPSPAEKRVAFDVRGPAPKKPAVGGEQSKSDRDGDDELPLQDAGAGVRFAGRLLDDDGPAQLCDARRDAELAPAVFVGVLL